MSEFNIDKWTDYRITSHSRDLDFIQHVTHVPIAADIVRDKKLKADLIYDKSRLNTERIQVVWLSPNDWTPKGGFRYGSIAYRFDWKKLTEGKRYYWVGAMDYDPIACRFLITDQDRDEFTDQNGKKLQKYDPRSGDGPWICDENYERHQWNGNFCLEFMLERSIAFDEATEIRPVDHHPQQCCIDHETCVEKGTRRLQAAGLFVASLASRRLTLPQRFVDPNSEVHTDLAQLAWNKIFRTLEVQHFGKGAIPPDAELAVGRAILENIAQRDDSAAEQLIGLFSDLAHVRNVVAQLIGNTFGITPAELLGDKW